MELGLQVEIAVAVLVAAFISAIVGMDRERRGDHTAGLRTHMLVGVGACLFTALSIHTFPGSDPARLAAQIVVALGFLGAGVIVQSRHGVHHLTTAADIWVTAAIGIAVGLGAYYLALTTAIIVWIILAVVRLFAPTKRPDNNEDHS